MGGCIGGADAMMVHDGMTTMLMVMVMMMMLVMATSVAMMMKKMKAHNCSNSSSDVEV